MRKVGWLMAVALLSACSNSGSDSAAQAGPSQETKAVSQASFAYPSIHWNDTRYKVTEEKVDQVDEEIGEIAYTSTDNMKVAEQDKDHPTPEPERADEPYSNLYAKGTKIYSIADTDPFEAVAVRIGDHEYVKAVAASSP